MRALTEVFVSARGDMAHAHMARLAVLYEDLRIEVTGAAQLSIPVLDTTDERYRRNYFLRRSIATLLEFAETVRLLNECPEFKAVKTRFNTNLISLWDKGYGFFQRHERFFRNVRNDIGGHFGLTAALFAVTNLKPEAVGKIEARQRRTMHLHFAGELVATATLRHLQGSTNEQKFSRLLRTVVSGSRHATECTHCIALAYLWERFGR
jgi:hypothetical protein